MYQDCDLGRIRLMLDRLRTLNKHVKSTKHWWTTVNTTSERKSKQLEEPLSFLFFCEEVNKYSQLHCLKTF